MQLSPHQRELAEEVREALRAYDTEDGDPAAFLRTSAVADQIGEDYATQAAQALGVAIADLRLLLHVVDRLAPGRLDAQLVPPAPYNMPVVRDEVPAGTDAA
jgi:hypothetical protein